MRRVVVGVGDSPLGSIAEFLIIIPAIPPGRNGADPAVRTGRQRPAFTLANTSKNDLQFTPIALSGAVRTPTDARLVPHRTAARVHRRRPSAAGDPRRGDTIASRKTAATAAGIVPGSDWSNKRLSFVRTKRRATTGDQRGAHDGSALSR